MPSTFLYLIRHGRVVGGETRRFVGHLDVPLSPEGEAEITALALRLAGVRLAAVYSSDLARARRSAELVAAPHGLVPRIEPALREMAMGRWEGLTAEEIQLREPGAFSDWMSRIGEFGFPEGESLPDLLARCWPVVERLVDAHAGERVAIVAHGGTNRAILCRALGLPLERLLMLGQDYGAVSLLEWDGRRWFLHLLNDTGTG
ncbi:MAG: histidine phosphatase family protein [Candidatus Rokubacteria bacterium]|nr:histidine phosphatase family protein [Candidatus Rokubacteria bacterium]